MLDVCPLCGDMLRNGKDSDLDIEYRPEDRALFDAGEITLEELNKRGIFYYYRDRLCFHSGNENTFADEDGTVFRTNPPCQNFFAKNGGTIDNPDVVVEKVKMIDN